ncbi:hypothetical protein Pla86_41790 [Planctomycetes bacterium Pla86]|uniref:Bacterial Pleckstrin homology domain-containing protein n=2 Tax=Engelhardtia mirabilis TaxID=2528011 RepID=A0A518BQ13_9BACT|nr:hypothetical protein Pla133_41800 [Planctomycetes bacterium Pla133]QDV03391.1 hypothetical protein Pla86_41790 [Planctomycetes bacterium Pla86]
MGALLLAGLLALAPMAFDDSTMPPIGVVGGSGISAETLAGIESVVPLEPGERVLFFYSAGLFSYGEDGNLLTDRRVVSWTEEDGQPQVVAYPWNELMAVAVEDEGNWLMDAIFAVEAFDGTIFYLAFAADEGLQEDALRELRSRIDAAKK